MLRVIAIGMITINRHADFTVNNVHYVYKSEIHKSEILLT